VLVVGPERGLELEFEMGRAQTVPDYAPARASGSGSGYHANTIPVADDVVDVAGVAASRQTNTHAHAYPCANNSAVALTGVQVQVRVHTLSHPDVVPTACAFEWVARMLGSDSDSGSAVDAKVRKGGTGCAAHG
jgi:hypothetical protein